MSTGLYARILAWSSRSLWLASLTAAWDGPQGESARERARAAGWTMSRDTFLRVAAAEAEAADSTSGRNVMTSHDTLAATSRMSRSTARRARDLMQWLGYSVTVIQGRLLSLVEQAQAHAENGTSQDRIPSVRALTTPIENRPAVENEHLPSRFKKVDLLTSSRYSPRRVNAPDAVAPRPRPRRRKRKDRVGETGSPRMARPIALQRLAAELVAWFGVPVNHVGSICDLLVRLDVDPEAWTLGTLVQCANSFVARKRVPNADVPSKRSPVGFFAWMIAGAISTWHEDAEHRQRLIDAAAERDARLARQRAERDAERARAATLTLDEMRRIRAESEREIAAMNRAKAQRDEAEREARRRRSSPLAKLAAASWDSVATGSVVTAPDSSIGTPSV